MALGLPSVAQLRAAAETEYKDGNKFLEFRLDCLANPGQAAALIASLRKSYADIQILATCRLKPNGGGVNASIDEQIAILTGAAKAGAVAVDLEIESAALAIAAVATLRQLLPVIISYHNFESTPSLDPIIRRLRRVPADAYKIATTARKPSDNLRLLEFVRKNNGVPLVALAMSEVGVASRILAPSMGSAYTYAASQDHDVMASGQLPARSMRALYRSDKLSRNSRVFGVVADPVSHSKSPVIHNRAFQARRIDAVYLPFRVGASQLNDWMTFACKLPVSGFSVTIPHKQRILRHLDIVEPLAKRIGAVNTVWRKGGKWRGTNTDAEGVMKPLGTHLKPAHASVLIAGYGGAARAAAFALADAGASLTITGRNLKRAKPLADAVKAELVTLAEAERNQYDALLHATPLGMTPNIDDCLFADRIPAEIVFDMVYNPHETELLKRASAQGCTIIHGIEMLLEQAARQFEIWTGESAPRAVMQKALKTE